MTKSTILDDDAIAEIEAMFPHAEYQPALSPDEVDPCEFCKGTIDDHKANCVVPHVHALCATVRAEREAHMVTVENLQETLAKRDDLQSQLEQVTKERDELKDNMARLGRARAREMESE